MAGIRRFQKIVVAVGGPEDAAETVPVVTDLARAFDAQILVVHLRQCVVASGGMTERESIPQAEAYGEQVAEGLAGSGVAATLDVRSALPDAVAAELLAAARAYAADLIVIGPHHAHGMHQRMFGDLGRAVVHGSACPVLLMPTSREQPDSS